jgi:hypothetical protein
MSPSVASDRVIPKEEYSSPFFRYTLIYRLGAAVRWRPTKMDAISLTGQVIHTPYLRMRHLGKFKKMWLLLLGVWKCGRMSCPQLPAVIVERRAGHSRSCPQCPPDLRSLSGHRGPKSGSFPRFHRNPQPGAGKIDRIVHTRPQCGERAEGCGHPQQLCTGADRRETAHKLSRVGYPLFHGLSTKMWIVFTSPAAAERAPEK